MSHYIVIVNWSGGDISSATPKMAKVFRMSPNRAANIMEDVATGVSWKFEKMVSDSQASQAQTYLNHLGFEVEIIPAEIEGVIEPSKEILPSQVLPPQSPLIQQENKESLFSKLKSMGGAKEGSSSGNLVSPQEESFEEKKLKKSFFSKPAWLGGQKKPETQPEPPLSENVAKVPQNKITPEQEIADKKESFFSKLPLGGAKKTESGVGGFLKPGKGSDKAVPKEPEKKPSFFSKLGSSKTKEVKEEAVSSPTQVGEPPPYKRGYQAEEERNPKEIVRTSPVAQLFMVLLIILFLALGGMPYWLGMQIEIKFNQLPIQIAKSADMVWINTRFNRKWFESEAENILKFPKHDLTFKMTHKISHGFLLFGEILRGDYKRNIIKILDGKIEPYLGQGILDTKVVFVNQSQNLPNFSPLNIRNRVKLDGSIFGEFNMPIYKNPPGQPFFLSWQGLNGTALLSSDFKNVLIKASSFPLLVRDGENVFLINQVRAELNSQERPGGQKILAYSIGVDRVSYREKKQVASLRSLDFIGNSIESGFDQSITLTSILEEYEDGNEKYGPATMAMQLRNLNPVIMKSLREQAFIFSKTGGKDSKTISKIRELLNGLKNKPPQLEVSKIELNTPKGKIDGALLVDYKGVDIPSTGFKPLMLLNGIGVKGRVGLPAIYLDQEFKTSENGNQVTMQIPVKDFEEKGFISKDGSRYVTQLEWGKGVLKLNGKPFDLMSN
jgi:hypothetical protein